MRMPKIAALALLAAAVCGAQIPDDQKTLGALNGRFWMSLDQPVKTYFIVGYSEAIQNQEAMPFLALAAHDCAPTAKGMSTLADAAALTFPANGVSGDVIKALDRLYGEPENLSLSLPLAFRVISMKFRSDKPEDIDAELRRLRILSRQPASAPAKAK